MTIARVQWPDKVSAGEVVKVRILIQHPMDTGYLQDLLGKLVPRNVIRLLICKLGSREVLRVEPSSGIAANPLFEFFVRATETAEMHVTWVDDKGQRGEHTQTMVVSPSATKSWRAAPCRPPLRSARAPAPDRRRPSRCRRG